MKLPFITREAVSALESGIVANLPTYRTGKTATLVAASHVRESRVDVEQLPILIDADGNVEPDAVAARKIFQWLQRLNVTQASDCRLWTYLTHVAFADYVHRRWGSGLIESVEPEERVVERWFFRGVASATYFRNGLSRLWWFAHLTYDADSAFELTDILLSLQDLQAAFLERSLGRCKMLLGAVLRTYKEAEARGELGADRGEKVKRWAVALNSLGGAYLFDALPVERLEWMVRQKLREVTV